MMRTTWNRRPRFGLTLIELLVVLTVLVILLSVAVPLMRPAFKDRKLREASRQVNAMLTRAKAEAVESGRSVGIWIERRRDVADVVGAGSGWRQGVRVYLAAVEPPFAGSSQGSTVRIDTTTFPQRPPRAPFFEGWLFLRFSDPGDATGAVTYSLLNLVVPDQQSFKIKFGGRGQWYNGIRDGNNYICRFPFADPQDNRAPPGTQFPRALQQSIPVGIDSPVSFQILRGPKRTSAAPIEMPGDVVIDLGVSGWGPAGVQFDPNFVTSATTIDSAPVIIMFNPAGHVESVYVEGWEHIPDGSVHLLLGRNVLVRDPVTTNFAQVESNLTDPSTVWVSISHRTGYVTTAENVDTRQMNASIGVPQRVAAARDIARRGVRMGGR